MRSQRVRHHWATFTFTNWWSVPCKDSSKATWTWLHPIHRPFSHVPTFSIKASTLLILTSPQRHLKPLVIVFWLCTFSLLPHASFYSVLSPNLTSLLMSIFTDLRQIMWLLLQSPSCQPPAAHATRNHPSLFLFFNGSHSWYQFSKPLVQAHSLNHWSARDVPTDFLIPRNPLSIWTQPCHIILKDWEHRGNIYIHHSKDISWVLCNGRYQLSSPGQVALNPQSNLVKKWKC